LTIGQEEFRAADTLARDGKLDEAVAAFKRLQSEYKDSWIDRVATQRLAMLHEKLDQKTQLGADSVPSPQRPVTGLRIAASPENSPGLAAKYPGDRNIDKDPRVLFVEDFEEPTLDALKSRWED